MPTHDIATARRFHEDTLSAKIIDEMGEMASAWFTDPEGNILSVTQLPS